MPNMFNILRSTFWTIVHNKEIFDCAPAKIPKVIRPCNNHNCRVHSLHHHSFFGEHIFRRFVHTKTRIISLHHQSHRRRKHLYFWRRRAEEIMLPPLQSTEADILTFEWICPHTSPKILTKYHYFHYPVKS